MWRMRILPAEKGYNADQKNCSQNCYGKAQTNLRSERKIWKAHYL